MELIDLIPVFNLYEEFWKIYTRNEWLRPQYVAGDAVIDKAIMGDGCEVYGEVHNSVIGSDVVIEEGAIVRDSIIMNSVTIGKGTVLDRTIVSENTQIGANCVLGAGEEDVKNKLKPDVYAFNLVTVGENTVIPDGVSIGKNTAISGKTSIEDYPGNVLPGGETLIKAGDAV
jgi:glucose-1-phosphate adenylyltransferase